MFLLSTTLTLFNVGKLHICKTTYFFEFVRSQIHQLPLFRHHLLSSRSDGNGGHLIWLHQNFIDIRRRQ